MSKRFGSTPSDGALSFGNEDESTFRENLDPEQLVRLQINRCNVARSSGDELLFNNNVLSLLAMIPQRKRVEIELNGSYVTEEESYDYVYRYGRPLGTPEKPFYTNLPDSDSYDPELKQTLTRIVKKTETIVNPDTGEEKEVEVDAEEEYETVGEPVLISPKKTRKQIIDYSKLFTLIITELENLKMWFRIEDVQEDGGDWDLDEKKPVPPPNPTPPPWPVKENPDDDESDEDQ